MQQFTKPPYVGLDHGWTGMGARAALWVLPIVVTYAASRLPPGAAQRSRMTVPVQASGPTFSPVSLLIVARVGGSRAGATGTATP